MKKTLIFFLSLLTASGCTGDEGEPELGKACPVDAVEGQENEIVGKWKMVWQRPGFSNDYTDYSCNNTMYHFKPDGILEVSNDVEGVGYSTGDYSYEFVSDPYNSGVADVRGLKISGSLPWGYQIEATTMMLDLSFLDGPLKYFIRIE